MKKIDNVENTGSDNIDSHADSHTKGSHITDLPIGVNKETSQHIYIYKSHRRQGAFLYLPEKDNFDAIPQSLLDLLGELSFSFEFNLTKNRKLIQTDAKTVLKHISKTGYFVQLPPPSNIIPTSLDDALPSGF